MKYIFTSISFCFGLDVLPAACMNEPVLFQLIFIHFKCHIMAISDKVNAI